jgi:large subunit ribosomal protein L3
LVLVKGSVPGSKGGYVLMKDAVKKALPENAPFPAGIKTAVVAQAQADAPATEADSAESEAENKE